MVSFVFSCHKMLRHILTCLATTTAAATQPLLAISIRVAAAVAAAAEAAITQKYQHNMSPVVKVTCHKGNVHLAHNLSTTFLAQCTALCKYMCVAAFRHSLVVASAGLCHLFISHYYWKSINILFYFLCNVRLHICSANRMPQNAPLILILHHATYNGFFGRAHNIVEWRHIIELKLKHLPNACDWNTKNSWACCIRTHTRTHTYIQ